MILEEFPIKGQLKEPLLILECIIASLFLELAFIFIMRIRSKKQELKSLQEKAYVWIFFGYSFMWLFIIISDYYIPEGMVYTRNLLLNIGYMILAFCALYFLYIMEKYKIFIKKFIFSKIFFICLLIYIFIVVFMLEIAAYFSSIFWIIFSCFIIINLNEIYKEFYIKRELGHIKKEFIKLSLGLSLIILGYQLSTRITVQTLGLIYRIYGDIFQLIGIFLIAWFLFSIPSFSEYDWHDKIDSLLLMYKSGLFIYQRKFKKTEDEIDESLISGTLTTLKLMIEKITEDDDILTIEKKGKIIIIQPGKFIFGVIISEENLVSLQILLNKFIEKVETIYSNVLREWDGNLKIFKPLDDISKEIFF